MPTRSLVTAVLSLFTLCASAAAASPVQPLSALTPMVLAEPSDAQHLSEPRSESLTPSVVYSNFGPSGALYNCCTGRIVSGVESPRGGPWAEAVRFTPTTSTTLQQVRLGLSYVSGTGQFVVSLHANQSGLPGRLIAQMSAASLPAFGSCCLTVDGDFGNPALVAGRSYWIVVETAAPWMTDTLGHWNHNGQGIRGMGARKGQAGWVRYRGLVGALEVLGR